MSTAKQDYEQFIAAAGQLVALGFQVEVHQFTFLRVTDGQGSRIVEIIPREDNDPLVVVCTGNGFRREMCESLEDHRLSKVIAVQEAYEKSVLPVRR